MLASPASAARRSSRFHTRPDLPISTKSFASSVATRSESTRHAGSSNSRSNATTLSTSSKPPIVLRLPNLRAPESAANVRCARLPKECCHSIRPRVTAAQRRSGGAAAGHAHRGDRAFDALDTIPRTRLLPEDHAFGQRVRSTVSPPPDLGDESAEHLVCLADSTSLPAHERKNSRRPTLRRRPGSNASASHLRHTDPVLFGQRHHFCQRWQHGTHRCQRPTGPRSNGDRTALTIDARRPGRVQRARTGDCPDHGTACRHRRCHRRSSKMRWCYDALMRTTIDLPQDLHDLARQLAHDSRRSMSDVIEQLIRLGLTDGSGPPRRGTRGLPQITVGRSVTAEDVRSLDDE